MIRYDFTRHAERMLSKLPRDIAQRIVSKVEHYLAQDDPLVFATRIVGSRVPSYRFQVGDYRVIFDWCGDHILITKVGHRREVYR